MGTNIYFSPSLQQFSQQAKAKYGLFKVVIILKFIYDDTFGI